MAVVISSVVLLQAQVAHADTTLPTTYGDGIVVPCAKDTSYNYTCLSSTGYQGQAIWGANYPDTSGHNCTSYLAWRLKQNGASQFTVYNANNWGGSMAQQYGWTVNQTPVVGSVAWWGPNSSAGSVGGHVAYVEGVGSNYVDVSEDNYEGENGNGSTYGYDDTRRLYNSSATGSYGWPTGFIHIKDVSGGGGGGNGSPVPKSNSIASLGRDNTVWYTQPGVQGWTPTGSGFFATGSPSIAELPSGKVVIAALGANQNNIWYTIPGVQGWTSTGSTFVGSSDPAVAVSSSGTITITVRGTDNTVWYTQPGVQGWTPTGSGFFATGSPSIAELPSGKVVIAALGANQNNIWYTIPGVQGWTSTGSTFVGSSDPAVAVSSSGTITITVRGTDNTVWYTQPGVQGWTPTGSGFFATGSPSIAELPSGKVVIAALGANQNNIWYTIPGVQGWTSTGSTFVGSSDAAVGVNASGQIDIVVRGTDNTVWYTQPGVQGWTPTGNGFFGSGNPAINGGSQPTGPETPPSITNSNSATFPVEQLSTFVITSTGTPTAAVSETGVLPTGVEFHDNGNGSAALVGTPASGSVGSYSISFTAVNRFTTIASQSFTLHVAAQGTSTIASTSPRLVLKNARVTFVAAVKANVGSVSGRVLFYLGSKLQCAATLTAGKATCPSTVSLVGTDVVIARFLGSKNYLTSSGKTTITVKK